MGPRPAPLVYAPLEFRVRSGGAPSKDSAFITCPKCEAPCFIRRSQRITAKVKHLDAHCTNTGCAHTFMAEVSFVHTFSPGLIERPDLDLPICPREKVPQVMPAGRNTANDSQMSMFEPG
jgi:hypothetical protein